MKRILSCLSFYICVFHIAHGLVLTAALSDSVRHYALPAFTVLADKPSETIGLLDQKHYDPNFPIPETNMKEAMNDLSGVNITTGAKGESNLRIRGFRKNEVKIMLNGRPMTAGYFGNLDLLNIPTSDIQEIQVLKGPVSSLLGSNTLGGVVNIVTRQPTNQSWFRQSMQFKRNNTMRYDLSSSHRFSDWDYWIFSSYQTTDGYMLSNDFKPALGENGSVRNHSQRSQYDWQVRYNHSLAAIHTIGFTAGYTYMPEKYIPSATYENNFRRLQDWNRYSFASLGNFVITPISKLETQLFLDGGGDTYQQFNDAAFSIKNLNSIVNSWTYGFNLLYKLDWNSQWRWSASNRSEMQYMNRKDTAGYLEWTSHYQFLNQSALQAEWAIRPNWVTTFGTGFSLFRQQNHTKIKSQLEPSLGINYTLPSYGIISASYAVNSAYPTMRQLFSHDRGNPDLKPQVGYKYEACWKLPFTSSLMNGSFHQSFYYNRVLNLIDIVQDSYQNIYHVNSYGTESELTLQPLPYWEQVYTFAWLQYDSGSDYRLTESPKNAVDIKQVITLPFQTKLTYDASWKDIRQSQDGNYRYHALPSYWLHDLRLEHKWKHCRLQVALTNLFDQNYDEEFGYPAEGRNFLVGIETEW